MNLFEASFSNVKYSPLAYGDLLFLALTTSAFQRHFYSDLITMRGCNGSLVTRLYPDGLVYYQRSQQPFCNFRVWLSQIKIDLESQPILSTSLELFGYFTLVGSICISPFSAIRDSCRKEIIKTVSGDSTV